MNGWTIDEIINHIRIICGVYETSTHKIERIMQFVNQVEAGTLRPPEKG